MFSCLLTSDLYIVNEFENVRIIGQIVGAWQKSDQNGDRVYKNDKSYHICSIRLIVTFSRV